MKLVTFLVIGFALAVSLNVFAGEKCRQSVQSQLPAGYSLLNHPSVVLQPGQDDSYMMGEIWNDYDETLEYYGTQHSNGYYKVYIAFGASVKSCKVVRRIEIGDDL